MRMVASRCSDRSSAPSRTIEVAPVAFMDRCDRLRGPVEWESCFMRRFGGEAMSWSWKIGNFRGIALYVHATFVLLLGWILVSQLLAGHGAVAAARGILFIVLLFLCVVLHEFGHALTAQRFG